MKNRWKHIFIPVLAMTLCLSLAACILAFATKRRDGYEKETQSL